MTIVRYHPTAENILVSASMDNTVRVWDLEDFSEIGILEGHTNQVIIPAIFLFYFSCVMELQELLFDFGIYAIHIHS